MHEQANTLPATQVAVENLMAVDEPHFEDAAVNFVFDRIGDLTDETLSVDGPIHRYQGPHDAFIGHDTEVRPMPKGTGFYVDDANAYMLTLRHMQELRNPEEGALTRPEYVGKALQAVQGMEGEYFENLNPSDKQAYIRKLAMLQGAVPGSEYVRPPSISELKDVALCTERSALAHNALKLLGVRSKLIFGGMEVDGKKFAHTFVEVEDGQDGSMIFDPMNPWLTVNESRELVGVEPSVTPLPEVSDGTTAVESGMKVRVQIGGETREAEQPCTYLFKLEQSTEDDRKTQEVLAKLALLNS